jgi:acyl-CoA synthetase (AMP-forming)/AMP-acid ligase II
MSALPLIAGFAAGAVLARRGAETVSPARFIGDVRHLAARLPRRSHVLNLCSDRYRFAVGLSAAMLRNQVSLLPPNNTPELLAQLTRDYPEVYCLTEAECTTRPPASWLTLIYDERVPGPGGDADGAVPLIPADQLAAIVFTSGSTGAPVPNLKTWGRLVKSADAEISRLGLRAHDNMTLLATVPPQHMYGLESTVLMALQGGMALHAGRPGHGDHAGTSAHPAGRCGRAAAARFHALRHRTLAAGPGACRRAALRRAAL